MHCPQCGVEIPDDSKFCSECGAQIGAAATESSPAERIRNSAKDTSSDKEEDLWEGTYSGKAMVGQAALAVIGSIALLVAGIATGFLLVCLGVIVLIWLYFGISLLLKKMNYKYELTSQRFIHKSGILTRVTDRIEVIDIDDVTFQQGIVERMVGVGTIRIQSSDRTHPELALKGIDEVQRIADMIDDCRRQERRRRGLHIEAI